MNKLKVVILVLAILLVSGCSQDEWEGFVYPNKFDLTVHDSLGVFESLDSCRTAALETLMLISSIENGDYECGLNCGYRNSYSTIKTCEKTER